MANVNTETTLGDLVTEDTRRAQIFEQLGIDYCCGGDRSLAEACREKELHPETVLQMLQAIPDVRATASETEDPSNMSLTELIDHIESTHHVYLREELPRIEDLLKTVVQMHGDQAPWMRQVKEVFDDLKPELLYHLEQEEEVVFPIIQALETNDSLPDPDQSHEHLIVLREDEHDEAGAALAEIRELTDDFSTPEWACNTFQMVIDSLAKLEADTHQHVHKENNILFRRARALL